jgi:hypothetical protein
MRPLRLSLFVLCLFAISVAFITTPVLAVTCSNGGTPGFSGPDDTGDGDATACGSGAVAGGENSTAYGTSSSSAGGWSAAMGTGATSAGQFSAALSYQANASGASSLALGHSSYAFSAGSTALGYGSYAGGANSAALGQATYASGENSTALGHRAYVTQPDTLILGSIAGVFGATAYARIGIGTNTPVEAVDVARSAAAARFQLTSYTYTASEAPQFIQRRARCTSAAPVAVANNDNLGLFSFRGYDGTVMGGSRATITAQAAGNFSGTSTPTRLIFATTPVGQTAPQQVLVITPDGKVQVNGQNLTVPDYVFEDDYQLMPLDELKAFIDTNGHLPGIPSADEVNAGGHDLAGSDMAHLRKIEELTLYTLQQQKRIEQLESQQQELATLLNRALAKLD